MNKIEASQTNLPFAIDDLDGDIFELYVRGPNREFMRHSRFVVAETLDEAEDMISEVIPDYWKTMTVRSVDFGYVWNTYESLHFSYNICKSILGV
jgi:hypothetical protein